MCVLAVDGSVGMCVVVHGVSADARGSADHRPSNCASSAVRAVCWSIPCLIPWQFRSALMPLPGHYRSTVYTQSHPLHATITTVATRNVCRRCSDQSRHQVTIRLPATTLRNA